jgi:hypothetical protein
MIVFSFFFSLSVLLLLSLAVSFLGVEVFDFGSEPAFISSSSEKPSLSSSGSFVSPILSPSVSLSILSIFKFAFLVVSIFFLLDKLS